MKINTKELNKLRKHTDTPIFAYCRKLIKEGLVDPEEILEAWGPSTTLDKDILYFKIKIKEGAELTVNQKTTTFEKYDPPLVLEGA